MTLIQQTQRQHGVLASLQRIVATAFSGDLQRRACISLADLEVLPQETKLLLAHSMQRNNNNMSLLSDDLNDSKQLPEGWLQANPRTTMDMISYRFESEVWRQLGALTDQFLTDKRMRELAVYRKRKTGQYPWVW
ncbi:MAG: hypothetical protein K2W95_25960 [Candidatus Obscuribacterales bacterium]|nr:hypothetical protein [Candidatus Obscuribacterales bacterium]